jgi:glycosyltransferase involved in cell wall biosynthesis
MISAIIITKNEEKMVEDCLKSLDWVDEIVLIDTGNTDKTNEIAIKYGAKIVKFSDEGSFAEWRNKGAMNAKSDWLFYIDADEKVSKFLKEEILLKTKKEEAEQYGCYAIPRKNFIFGKEFKHSGQYPDYQKRLIRKSTFKKWVGDVHEEPEFEGKMEHLKNPIIHKKNMTISQMVEKTNRWSEIEAKLMFDADHPPMNLIRFASAVIREFYLRMIAQLAFLDGVEGIIYAIYQVFSKFVSYSKLYEMQLKGEE